MDATVRTFLDYKMKHPHGQDMYSTGGGNSIDPSPPPATLLTFQFEPTYTLGRRERGTLTPDKYDGLSDHGAASVVETFRGGQTTFHGPGQLVAYPILDLRSFRTNSNNLGLPVRCYVELLERSVINVLAKAWGLDGATVTENTGVWMDSDHKICAMGIHVRRHVTSHGIGLNVNTDTKWFDRIVACGLPDKSTTTIAQQLRNRQTLEQNEQKVTTAFAAHAFAKELAQALNLELKEEEYL